MSEVSLSLEEGRRTSRMDLMGDRREGRNCRAEGSGRTRTARSWVAGSRQTTWLGEHRRLFGEVARLVRSGVTSLVR